MREREKEKEREGVDNNKKGKFGKTLVERFNEPFLNELLSVNNYVNKSLIIVLQHWNFLSLILIVNGLNSPVS